MPGFLPAQACVWLVVEPVDRRLGIDGLSARIQHSLGRSPGDGTAYAFRNRRGTRIKLLQWDGTGVWLSQRRLHRGSFVWPRAGERLFTLSQAQWQWLISGVDWQRLEARPRGHLQVTINVIKASICGSFKWLLIKIKP